MGLLLPLPVAEPDHVARRISWPYHVNLNYTVGKHGLESAVRQAQLRTIVTSRKFVEKAQLDLRDGSSIRGWKTSPRPSAVHRRPWQRPWRSSLRFGSSK